MLDSARWFRKQPTAIQAIQVHEPTIIHTIEGIMTAVPGSYIIRGVRGELYPCRADIFEETYEELPDGSETQTDASVARS